jgi:hypothetical protein
MKQPVISDLIPQRQCGERITLIGVVAGYVINYSESKYLPDTETIPRTILIDELSEHRYVFISIHSRALLVIRRN